MRTSRLVSALLSTLLLASSSTVFAQQQAQQNPPPNEPPPKPLPTAPDASKTLGSMLASLDSSLQQGELQPKTHKRLSRPLSKSQEVLWRLNFEKSLDHLNEFVERVAELEEKGELSAALAKSLQSEAVKVSDGIAALLIPLRRPLPVCLNLPPQDATYSWLHVDATAKAGGTGSPDSPFQSVTDAMKWARDAGSWSVTLFVHPGSYDIGELDVTRHTEIRGVVQDLFVRPTLVGNIVNAGPWDVGLYDLNIDASRSGPGVVAQHTCADTTLERVAIERANGFGVRQSAGTLFADALSVSNTHASSASDRAAIQIDAGAQAQLIDVLVRRTHGSALVASGAGTSVRIDTLDIARTTKDAFDPVFPGSGAVVVSDAASLQGSVLRIANSEVSGLATWSGGSADVSLVRITDSATISAGTQQLAGFGAASYEGPIRLEGFVIERAELCGVFVTEAGDLDLADGIVSNNTIGACVQSATFNIDRLTDRVRYVDNLSNLDSPVLPEPPVVP